MRHRVVGDDEDPRKVRGDPEVVLNATAKLEGGRGRALDRHTEHVPAWTNEPDRQQHLPSRGRKQPVARDTRGGCAVQNDGNRRPWSVRRADDHPVLEKDRLAVWNLERVFSRTALEPDVFVDRMKRLVRNQERRQRKRDGKRENEKRRGQNRGILRHTVAVSDVSARLRPVGDHAPARAADDVLRHRLDPYVRGVPHHADRAVHQVPDARVPLR